MTLTDRPSVLMTADAIGGVWTYALDLARGLGQAGVRTTLAVLGPSPGGDQRAEAAAIPGLEVIETGLPLDWTANRAQEVEHAGVELAALAAHLRPDVIHLNSPALAADAAFGAPVVAVCHSCLATWWAAVKGGAAMPDDFRWRIELTARGYARADALVANSRAFAEATAQAYGLERAPIPVLNGRRPRAGTAAADAPEDVFAFTAGRLWDEGKGAATLDRAAARTAVPVVAAGPLQAPDGGSVGLGHVRILGRLGEAEVAGWLARRPIFVSAALYEPFGLAALEAAQAGCALILSDIPTFRELWDGAAVFTPPGDDAALAAALEALAADPARRAWLGRAARERAGRYTAQAMAAGMLAVYRALAPAAFGATEAAA